MIVVWVVVGLLAVLSGILLSGKGGFLIAGYNTATQEEKAKYDEKKLCRAMGIMLSVITIATGLLLFGIMQNNSFSSIYCGIVFPVLIAISIIIGLFYTNTKCLKAPKADSDVVIGINEVTYSQDYKKEKKKRIVVIIAVCFGTLVLTGALVILFINSSRPPVYIISDGNLKISAEFGETISLSDIESMQLKDTMPDNLSKKNGSGLGTILKGRFQSDGEDIQVYADTSKPPFLYIYTKNGLTIVNGQTKSDTQALLQEIQSKK
jgi:hypothetical protein